MHPAIFIPFPVLTTDRFILRELSEQDAEAIYILRTDEEVNRYLDRQKANSIDDVYAFINSIRENTGKGKAILWAICSKDDARLMGTICLWNIDAARSCVDIGYELLPSFQGKGILQEVMPVVVKFGLDTIGIDTITAGVSCNNLKSVRLLEKHGFVYAGKDEQYPGENGDMIIYCLNKI